MYYCISGDNAVGCCLMLRTNMQTSAGRRCRQMVARAVGVYDEESIASISRQLAFVIDRATLGHSSFDEVAHEFGSAFPGSWTMLHNINLSRPSLNSLFACNIDPSYITTFQEHFAFVNPWIESHWSRVKSGVVAVSEEVAPARLYAKSEFYNDWLAPQGAEAATGIKIEGDSGESVLFFAHFPLAHAETYNRASAEVLRRTRGNLLRSIEVGRLLRKGSEAAIAEAALVERTHCSAFVVDETRVVRESNQHAVDIFSAGTAICVSHGRVHLLNKDADDKFGKVLLALSRGTPVDGSRISFWAGDCAWQMSLARLPMQSSALNGLSLLPSRRLTLVLVTNLSANRKPVADLSALSMFGLTRSEVSFCRQLLSGDSVSEAADHLGITVETARTKLKAILQKTATSRQGQLILLLSRLL